MGDDDCNRRENVGITHDADKKIGKEIYIAKAGTKTLIGKVTIEKCRPLTNDEYHLFEYKHKAKGIYPNRKVYGWFLTNPIQFKQPITYIHPHGAQIWVKLPPIIPVPI